MKNLIKDHGAAIMRNEVLNSKETKEPKEA